MVTLLVLCAATWAWFSVLPRDSWPRNRPFFYRSMPAIKDWKTLAIVLKREACLGKCPVYQAQIDGSGHVVIHVTRWAHDQETHTKTLSQADVRALYSAFQQADFYWLHDDYGVAAFDAPTIILQVSFDGRSKAIRIWNGGDDNSPKSVALLIKRVDALTGALAMAPDPPLNKTLAARPMAMKLAIPPRIAAPPRFTITSGGAPTPSGSGQIQDRP